jgi:hypothetical protein
LPVEIPPVIPMTAIIRNIDILYVQRNRHVACRRNDQ